MKKQIIPIILLLLAVICFSIGFSSCSILCYETTTPTYQGTDAYIKWKAEQADILQRQINYANSAEFKRLYGGGAPNNTNGPAAKSVIGTNADPLGAVRNSTITPATPIQIEIRPIKY
jgi:hypothetical protein